LLFLYSLLILLLYFIIIFIITPNIPIVINIPLFYYSYIFIFLTILLSCIAKPTTVFWLVYFVFLYESILTILLVGFYILNKVTV
jgi:hypothetical protein